MKQKGGACILFRGPLTAGGYGRAGKKAAHRAAYERHVGPIPEGMEIDHLCHTWDLSCPGGVTCLHRRCINPKHLEPVTRRENQRRGRGFIAVHAAKTHCIHGHPFDEANTYLRPTGRSCRTCLRAANLRFKLRRQAAA